VFPNIAFSPVGAFMQPLKTKAFAEWEMWAMFPADTFLLENLSALDNPRHIGLCSTRSRENTGTDCGILFEPRQALLIVWFRRPTLALGRG
jgi:hypothetical protein